MSLGLFFSSICGFFILIIIYYPKSPEVSDCWYHPDLFRLELCIKKNDYCFSYSQLIELSELNVEFAPLSYVLVRAYSAYFEFAPLSLLFACPNLNSVYFELAPLSLLFACVQTLNSTYFEHAEFVVCVCSNSKLNLLWVCLAELIVCVFKLQTQAFNPK